MKDDSINSSQPNQNQRGIEEEDELFVQAEKTNILFDKKNACKSVSNFLSLQPNSIVSIEALDKFYVNAVCPLKNSYKRLIEFYASILRMYTQESNENIYLKFLVLN